jgi:cellulose synthase/poly-beta-1,6-N-acetylglucosamine synthase-like glycosyltransferase
VKRKRTIRLPWSADEGISRSESAVSPALHRRSDTDKPEGARWQFLLLPAIAVIVAASGWVALALTISGLFLVLGLTMVQISALIIAHRPNRTGRGCIKQKWLSQGHAQPRVSIHVPCCNEPPDVVMSTLDALAQLDWNNYEVICLDNNTEDPAVWKPLQAHCRRLGDRFRFYHFEGVSGAKAGALNLALEQTDSTAEYIAVVDADYRVNSSFLHCAHAYLCNASLSHVQFPQAYRNTCDRAAGIAGDFSHYFDVFMPTANDTEATLLTGTMSVIRRSVLERIGGWSSHSVTEDAELGARLAIAGYSGIFVPEVVGRGILPATLEAMQRQRRRWVHGNASTLFGLTIKDWKQLGRTRVIGVVAQLTAWFNGLLLPVLVLAVVAAAGADGRLHMLAATLSGFAVLLQVGARAAIIALAPRSVRKRASLPRALAAHFGLAWEGASAWIESLLGVRMQFIRTDKSGRPGSVVGAVPALALSTLLLTAGFLYAADGMAVAALGAFAGAMVFAAVLELSQQLHVLRTA